MWIYFLLSAFKVIIFSCVFVVGFDYRCTVVLHFVDEITVAY